MQAVTEHLQQCVQDAPRITLEYIGKQLACKGKSMFTMYSQGK